MLEETTADAGTEVQDLTATAVVDETIASEMQESQIETQPEGTKKAEPEKKFTQEELDRIVTKRLARAERQRAIEQEQRAAIPQVPVGEININDFETTEAYLEALTTKKAHDLIQQQQAAAARSAATGRFEQSIEKVSDKYTDFEEVAFNPNLPITDVMRDAIFSVDDGAEVAYHLGTNPAEARRISGLSPIQQAAEIGRISARLAANPTVKKTSNAPAPISPVKTKGSGNIVDTTDPRSIEQMSTSEWIAAERQRQLRILKAKGL